jgi:hypothetical protein
MSQNCIGPFACTQLLQGLADNKSITYLDLSFNHLSGYDQEDGVGYSGVHYAYYMYIYVHK